MCLFSGATAWMDNCAVNNKGNNRRCTKTQQLRRDAASVSTSRRDLSGVVYGWIHHKFMLGAL